MKFKRISADTVRCFISSEELAANGLTVSDFMNSDGRCEEFIRKVVTLAQEEVDFKVYGGPMSIQVAALSEGTVALTFSERQDMGINEFLEALRAAVEKIKEQTGLNENVKNEQIKLSDDAEYMFYVESMDLLMDFLRTISPQIVPESALYRVPNEKGYYLIIKTGDTGIPVVDFIAMAIEFLHAVPDDEMKISYVKEHMQCVFKKYAVDRLLLLTV